MKYEESFQYSNSVHVWNVIVVNSTLYGRLMWEFQIVRTELLLRLLQAGVVQS